MSCATRARESSSSSAIEFSLPVSSQDLGAGHTVASVHSIPLTSPTSDQISKHGSASKCAKLHILQHQPTVRPIEDRYSTHFFPITQGTIEGSRAGLLLGVYDGHRGPWAAEHIAQALPGAIISALAQLHPQSDEENGSSAGSAHLGAVDLLGVFEKLDMQMLFAFEEAHPLPSTTTSARHRSILRTLSPSFIKAKRERQSQQKSQRQTQHVDSTRTPAALRVFSGCTASMLLLDLSSVSSAKLVSAQLINLGDSRTVLASLSSGAMLASSTDVNSGNESERARILSQHPGDDATDVFVGRRLFGDTLSTRAFGDAMYKLPISPAPRNLRAPMTTDQRRLHRHLIGQLSAHEVAARQAAGKMATIPFADRYDALFSMYKSPPYVSARPDVMQVELGAGTGTREDVTGIGQAPSLLAILASDGLWDLISSDNAVNIVQDAATDSREEGKEKQNLAEALFSQAIMRKGREPGDDVTILVLTL